MAIKVKAYLTMKQVVGNKAAFDVEFDEISILDLMIELAGEFGQDFKSMVFEKESWELGSEVRILLNGKHYSTLPEKLATVLSSGDEISLFPPIAGG